MLRSPSSEVIARSDGGFSGRGEAVAFTYYCRLPVALLIGLIMGPDESTAFPP